MVWFELVLLDISVACWNDFRLALDFPLVNPPAPYTDRGKMLDIFRLHAKLSREQRRHRAQKRMHPNWKWSKDIFCQLTSQLTLGSVLKWEKTRISRVFFLVRMKCSDWKQIAKVKSQLWQPQIHFISTLPDYLWWKNVTRNHSWWDLKGSFPSSSSMHHLIVWFLVWIIAVYTHWTRI